MLVRALRDFALPYGAVARKGDEFPLPEGSDYLTAGRVEVVETRPVASPKPVVQPKASPKKKV